MSINSIKVLRCSCNFLSLFKDIKNVTTQTARVSNNTDVGFTLTVPVPLMLKVGRSRMVVCSVAKTPEESRSLLTAGAEPKSCLTAPYDITL